jgi:SPP1 gp7 family putative phage head morphogenesis protein
MMPKLKTTDRVGKAIRPAVSIGTDYAAVIAAEIRAMALEIKQELAAFFDKPSVESGMDSTPADQAKSLISTILDRWRTRFEVLAVNSTHHMMSRTLRNATAGVNMSLKEIGEFFKIDTSYSDERLKNVIQASTFEASQLIKRIPEQYLSDVQGAVMRSITTGNGMRDLVPFLTEKYQGNVRHARNVALDQTRKAHAAISATQLQKVGVESYIWVHSGGSRHPRQEHIELAGNEFRYDDPPIIDKRTGFRGKPGDAIFCRCIAKPILKFNKVSQ